MYTECTEGSAKEAICQIILQGGIRIFIATVAFAMGLDCPDVQ